MLANIALALVGTVLALNGVAKAVSFERFRAAVSDYEPAAANSTFIAIGWIGAEIVSGLSLAAPFSGRFVPAAVIVAGAAGSVWRRISQDKDHDCGCTSSPHPISSRLIARNVVLVSGSLAGTYLVAGIEATILVSLSCLVAAASGYWLVGKQRAVAVGSG